MRFGYFYLNGRFTVYDVTIEVVGGHRVHVATLSENPVMRCLAGTPDEAVERLKQYLTMAVSAPAPTWSRQYQAASGGGR